MTLSEAHEVAIEEYEKAKRSIEHEQQRLRAAQQLLQEKIAEVEMARMLLVKEQQNYGMQFDVAMKDKEMLDHQKELCQQEADNYALARLQVLQQMEMLTAATEEAERERDECLRAKAAYQRDSAELQLQLLQVAEDKQKVEAEKMPFLAALQDKKALMDQLQTTKEEIAQLKTERQELQLSLQKVYNEQQMAVSGQEAADKEKHQNQVMYRRMIDQQRQVNDDLNERLRTQKVEFDTFKTSFDKELLDLKLALSVKEKDARVFQQANIRLQKELDEANEALMKSEKQRRELKASHDLLELQKLDLELQLRRAKADTTELQLEVKRLQDESRDLTDAVCKQEDAHQAQMMKRDLDETQEISSWMSTITQKHDSERKHFTDKVQQLEEAKRWLEAQLLQKTYDMEALEKQCQQQLRDLEKQLNTKEAQRIVLEEKLDLWRAEFLKDGSVQSAMKESVPLNKSSGALAGEVCGGTSVDTLPRGVLDQFVFAQMDADERRREFHDVRRRVDQLVHQNLLVERHTGPELSDQMWPPLTKTLIGTGYLPVGPENFREVTITLGHLLQLKRLFIEADLRRTGLLDVENLAEWCVGRGMVNVTYSHLEALVSAADPGSSGHVDLWGWIGIQTYLFLDLRARGVSVKDWMGFCMQAPPPKTKGPSPMSTKKSARRTFSPLR